MRNRIISMILVVSMILSITGCGSGSSMSEKLVAKAVLNEENLVLGKDGVELRLDPVMISSDLNASISEVSNLEALGYCYLLSK